MSDSLRPQRLQASYPSPSPRVYSNSCPLRQSSQPSCPLALLPSCPLLLLPSIFSSIRVFSNELALRIGWPDYWSFSFSISPFNEYSGLISFRINWFDLLAVQGSLKSPPAQFKNINYLTLSLIYGSTLTSIHSK